MKKPILFLLAISAGIALATVAPSAFGGSIFGFADSTETPQGREQGEDSPQAICRQVEVQLDEGYGVSSQETRVICQQNP